MAHLLYKTHGTCSQWIDIETDEGGTIQDVQFHGGCNGNLRGIRALVKGRSADKVCQLLKGITCGSKPTSCPDQLARALEQMLAKKDEPLNETTI